MALTLYYCGDSMFDDSVDYSALPNWRLIEIAARELSKRKSDGFFTREEIINYINNVLLRGREKRNPSSLNPMIQAVTANAPGGAPGGIGKNILYRVGRGLYRLFDPSTDKPIPEKDLGHVSSYSVEPALPEVVEDDILISRVDGAWRIVLPEKVREKLNLKVGDIVAFVEEGGKIVLRRARFRIELE